MQWNKLDAQLATALADADHDEAVAVVVSPIRAATDTERDALGDLAARAGSGRPFKVQATPSDVDKLSEEEWVETLSAPRVLKTAP